jgi:ATPase family protein associated with various cellular activities (AAA)
LKKIASELRGAAEKVLKMLKPSQNFLSSVLNRELAAMSLGTDSTWVPHEMAFAAASLGILGKRWREDKRLLHAGLHLSRAMSDRGEFPFSRPFHSVKEDLKVLYPASALRPFTELVRCVPDIPADLGIVKNMLRYFGETRMGQFGQDTKIAGATIGTDGYRKHGWFDEDGLQPHSFTPGPTIAAVRALAAINRMLDERINHIILRHFRIKTPDRDLKLELDALFYPDYGLRLIPATIDVLTGTGVDITHGKISRESEWSDDLRPEESVAVILQRMRAHVTRVSIPITTTGDRPFSVVLHEPPGTGKTTLVEALAKSCGVPFVEITPERYSGRRRRGGRTTGDCGLRGINAPDKGSDPVRRV